MGGTPATPPLSFKRYEMPESKLRLQCFRKAEARVVNSGSLRRDLCCCCGLPDCCLLRLLSLWYASPMYVSSRLSLSSENKRLGSSNTVGKMLPEECKGELLSESRFFNDKRSILLVGRVSMLSLNLRQRFLGEKSFLNFVDCPGILCSSVHFDDPKKQIFNQNLV